MRTFESVMARWLFRALLVAAAVAMVGGAVVLARRLMAPQPVCDSPTACPTRRP